MGHSPEVSTSMSMGLLLSTVRWAPSLPAHTPNPSVKSPKPKAFGSIDSVTVPLPPVVPV